MNWFEIVMVILFAVLVIDLCHCIITRRLPWDR